jgi:uncharacterized membrane protein YdbT with pleckstrin-like domain
LESLGTIFGAKLQPTNSTDDRGKDILVVWEVAVSHDVIVAMVVVGIVFFYRLNALTITMTRYYESRTNKVNGG